MNNYNIFISNACKYGVNYDKVVNCLNSSENFHWVNTANPKSFENINNTEQMYKILKEQINASEIVIFAVQMYFKHTDILTFQYDYAKSTGKPIIIIKPWLPNHHIPEHFSKDGLPTVSCDNNEIWIEIQKISK